jgi:predicted HicB family RNase H-like nuclease
MDLALKGIPYALGAKIQANAKAGGISLNEYIFKLVAEGVHFTG